MVGFYFFNFSTLLLAITFSGFCETNSNDCFNVKDYYWKHLASKTAYRYVANHNDSEIKYDACVPKKIFVIVRHGTRYPSAKLINKMNSRLVEIRDTIRDNTSQKEQTLCAVHLKNITDWTPQIDLADEKRLAHVGEDEMVELAERFQNRFPSLLNVEYSNSSFDFRSTATERTKKSKYHFTIGLFGRRIAHHVWSPEPIYKDPILRFYKLCPKWLKKVDKNPKSTLQVDDFKESDKFQKVVKNIGLRLGYKDLTVEDVELMYFTCTYESSWNRVSFSPWCAVFTEEDMQVMEFSRDLKYYWKDGYGYDINFKQACPIMEDFLRRIQDEDGPASTFYFTHSGTMLKLLSHLGLYYDEFILTHDKFTQPRLWRVSYMDAFGSNLAFVVYQCGDEQKLLTLHQERPVKLPGCPKDGLCRFEKILKVYKNSFTNSHTVHHHSQDESKLEACQLSNRIHQKCRWNEEYTPDLKILCTMKEDCDKVSLIKIKPEVSSFSVTQHVLSQGVRNENITRNTGKTTPKPLEIVETRILMKGTITESDETTEERQRTGRYLAIGVTLIMLFIAFYHTLLRHATVLAGLLAPAIIMLLYILWLFYFAKKKKTQVSAV